MCYPCTTESDTLPNEYIHGIISAIETPPQNNQGEKEDTRTELDSHANMCVFGSDCFVFEDSGKTQELIVHNYNGA